MHFEQKNWASHPLQVYFICNGYAGGDFECTTTKIKRNIKKIKEIEKVKERKQRK